VKEITVAESELIATAPDPEDAALVRALRAGEGWASEAIWDRYSDRVTRFFARNAGPALDDAEDLTQDVFLRLFASHRSIQKPASLRHFVMAIAIRVLHRQIRAQHVRRNVCLSVTGEMPDIETPARADDEARHALRRCCELLERLRTRERVAFALRHLEGMTLDEVAERLEISRSTAKRLISRAAKKISTRASRKPELRPSGSRRPAASRAGLPA
jgi:RNA polymerase sigma-70 factor (ECF subfamily)